MQFGFYKRFSPDQKKRFNFIVGTTGAVLAVVMIISLVVWLRGSSATTLAFQRAEKHPVVTEKLGEPVQLGWAVLGSISTSTKKGGKASLFAPIYGPIGSACLQVRATRPPSGDWTIDSLTLRDSAKIGFGRLTLCYNNDQARANEVVLR